MKKRDKQELHQKRWNEIKFPKKMEKQTKPEMFSPTYIS